MFRFLSNGGYPDSASTNHLLHDVVDYCIVSVDNLEDYVHMGKQKYIAIQAELFHELIVMVKNESKKIRKWYIDNTVSMLLWFSYFVIFQS